MVFSAEQHRYRAVIIDDHSRVDDILCQALEESAVDFELCEDFAEISALMDRIQPDLVFIELRMARTDGVQVLELLAERHCRSRIFIMGDQHQSILDSASRIGIQLRLNLEGALQKPFELESLRARIESALDTRSRFTSENFQLTLGAGEFVIHYHPIIVLSRERHSPIVGFEVRPHWRTEDGNKLWLSDLVDKVREAGLLPEYNRYLMSKALESYIQWLRVGVDLGITVSMDKANLTDTSWPDLLVEVANEYGVQHNRITIAIEQQAMKDCLPQMFAGLTRLRINDFKIAVDTMGKDVEELERLLAGPFSELRLRRILVNGIGHDMEAEFNVATLISLARKHDIDTCAVGVRTAEAYRFLQDCGCHTATGSLFGESLPVNKVSQFIHDEVQS